MNFACLLFVLAVCASHVESVHRPSKTLTKMRVASSQVKLTLTVWTSLGFPAVPHFIFLPNWQVCVTRDWPSACGLRAELSAQPFELALGHFLPVPGIQFWPQAHLCHRKELCCAAWQCSDALSKEGGYISGHRVLFQTVLLN